jgi:hypothetical protein
MSLAAPPSLLRPIRGLALAAVAMLALEALVEGVSAIIGLRMLAMVDRIIADPESVSSAEIDAGDALYSLSGIAETTALVVAGVVFVVWLFRARANAEGLVPWPHRRAKVWLVFGWVVPIVSLWFPKQIVDDIWNASRPNGLYPTNDFRTAARSGLVQMWWIAWLISSWISNLVGRMLFRADDLETVRAAIVFDLVSIGLMIVATVPAILVVLRITEFQENRRQGTHPQ